MKRSNSPTIVQSLFLLKMLKCFFIIMSTLKHILDIVQCLHNNKYLHYKYFVLYLS